MVYRVGTYVLRVVQLFYMLGKHVFKRFIAQRVYAACTRTDYKIVPLASLNKRKKINVWYK
jgi:hypothetical protein